MAALSEIHNGSAGWHPFGLTDEDFEKTEVRGGVKWVNVKLGGGNQDRSGAWLRGAMLALAALAAAAAAVSFEAQYLMVAAVKHTPAIAALEAAIPDVGALIFASLGIALALHGRRAIRARALNVACVGISLGMNALAAGHGWRDMAIWVMPSAVYASRATRSPWSAPGRSPANATAAKPSPMTRPRHWPSLAAPRCGCCVSPSHPHLPWAASVPGSSRNAPSPPAAKPAPLSPLPPIPRRCRQLATAGTDRSPARAATMTPRHRRLPRHHGDGTAAGPTPASKTG
jgi:hypothetical protein